MDRDRIVGSMAKHEDGEKLPIKMLNDRILVKLTAEGERRAAAASSSRPPPR